MEELRMHPIYVVKGKKNMFVLGLRLSSLAKLPRNIGLATRDKRRNPTFRENVGLSFKMPFPNMFFYDFIRTLNPLAVFPLYFLIPPHKISHPCKPGQIHVGV